MIDPVWLFVVLATAALLVSIAGLHLIGQARADANDALDTLAEHLREEHGLHV